MPIEADSVALRLLVACGSCKRQFDATGLAAGSRFHCACGQAVRVPRPAAHDAAVVRCSACGASRVKQDASCRYCGAQFTAHERDMHTLCPQCMTRVSDQARFCHHCATALAPQGHAGRRTDLPCPACGDRARLNGRSLGQPPLSVLECPRCVGLWVGVELLRLVLERARSGAELPAAFDNNGTTPNEPGGEGPLYRRCPDCRQPMHRRNFGRKSGVIIDACKPHGYWFDARELERILGWIRSGGEAGAERREREGRRESERLGRMTRALRGDWQTERPGARDGGLQDAIGTLLGSLFRL